MKLIHALIAIPILGAAMAGFTDGRSEFNSSATASAAPHSRATEANSTARSRAAISSDDSSSKIIEKTFALFGTKEDLAALTSTRFTGTNTTTRASGTVMLRVERITVFPSNFYVVFQDSRNTITKIIDTPHSSVQISGQTTTPISASQVTDLRLAVKLDPVYVAKYRGDFTCTIDGNEPIGKMKTVKLKISGQGAEAEWNIDAKSGQLLRTTYATTASGKVVTDYSDWRAVSGIQVAFKRHSETSKETNDVVVDQYEVNPKVDPKLFEVPSHN
jgi:hypothetical protein